jgi:DNA-binding IclR family transcriptional regulator
VSDKSYFSKSFEKGLKLLELFNKDVPALTQTQIAKRLGLNMTSTYRYINTLVEMGYLEKDESSKLIRPSIFCLVLCNNLMRATNHLHLIKTMVDDIHIRYNMTIDVALSVPPGDNMKRIYNKEAADTLTYRLPDVTSNSLHNTALGKAYLSSLPEEALVERVRNLQFIAKTEHTIIDADILIEQLLVFKKKRYAMVTEEYLPGLIAIASPIFNLHTSKGIGAVSFDFSTMQRSAEEIEEKFSGMVIDLADRISAIIPLDRQLVSGTQ